MRAVRALVSSLLLLALPGLAAAGEGDFYLKDGDRVVFYGDSITDQRLYTTFVETYVVTRFPRLDVSFVHSGWGGDRVGGGGGGRIGRRLQRDVIAYKPTVVTVMLGMNDASYRALDEKIFDTYKYGYRHLVEELKDFLPGVRITLIQPSPFDDVTRKPNFEGGYNEVLVRYGEFVKDLARDEKVDVADLNTPVVEALKRANEKDPDTAKKIVPDRVHPGPAGHLLMAEALLKAWNAPAMVTSVTIERPLPPASPNDVRTDERKPQIRDENTKVTGLDVKDGAIFWTQEDDALPLPIDMKDPVIALAVNSSDVVEALDRQMLKVVDAPASEYTLKIDGREVGKFSRDKLAEGINLATLDTPMARQAREVHALTLKHNNLHFVRWRQIQVPLQGEDLPGLSRAIEALDVLEADLVKQQRSAAQPKPRLYELVPQG
jgi:lysophospholipase L1-like esterase